MLSCRHYNVAGVNLAVVVMTVVVVVLVCVNCCGGVGDGGNCEMA